METPPSGWYPDPYRAPGLLRWWDGTSWTEHTHAEIAPAGTDPTTVQPAVTSVQPAVRQELLPAEYEPAVTRIQPAAQPASVQPTTVQPTTVQPGLQLGALQPPAGPRTSPQPAIPAGMEPDGGAGDGTRVLILDDNAWSAPGAPYRAAGGPDGYYRAQRNRRILLTSGLVGGVAASLTVIALIVSSLAQTGGTPAADSTPAVNAVASSAAAAPTAAPSSPPLASPSATAMATVTDASSGLTYDQLTAPFAPGCPASLSNQSFTWTAGESASAGQVNNGQTSWYGTACSGQLPAQYGYSGTTDLQNVANTLVNTFNGTYYAALPHTMSLTVNEPTAVSGHPAWEIQFVMNYTSTQGMAFTNELGAVVVADPQTGAAPAVFYASVPGNLNEANVATLVSSLQLAAVAPPASASATASATATAPATAPASPGAPPPGPPSPGGPGQGNGGQGGGNGGGH